MKAKFAKALAANITTIAGNVAHVALIDAGALNQDACRPLRAEACRKIEECQSNIASLLQQPGTWQSDSPGSTCPTANGKDLDRWEQLQAQNAKLRGLVSEACFALQQLQAMPDLRNRLHAALQQPIPEQTG